MRASVTVGARGVSMALAMVKFLNSRKAVSLAAQEPSQSKYSLKPCSFTPAKAANCAGPNMNASLLAPAELTVADWMVPPPWTVPTIRRLVNSPEPNSPAFSPVNSKAVVLEPSALTYR